LIEKIITHKSTPFDHYYKQKFIFYIHSINNVYGFYYILHTSFNEWI